MNEKKIEYKLLVPVLLSFFVMSFVDMVGIGVDRVSRDMNLSNAVAQLIPSATFLWFFVLSVPVGITQARIGKRKMLNIGMTVTGIGLLVPFIWYNFPMVLTGFALLGIGNTIVQVSANPLLVDVVPGSKAPSFLSFSQFVKAIGSMIAAPLAAFFAGHFTHDWKMLFLVFGIISFLSVLWLSTVKIEESAANEKNASLTSSFALLGNSYILMMVLSIFLVVGIDVGFNSFSGKYLTSHFGIDAVTAESGRSVYFFGRMLGTFAGAIILTKLSSYKGFTYSALLSIVAIAIFLVLPSKTAAWALVFIIGFGVANIFPLVFSLTIQKYPERSNEISGLMMMAISGGAVIPPLMGWISDKMGVVAGMSILILCAVYLFVVSFICRGKRAEA
jgi:MFS transporter, FHS family, L-fucose permease